MIYSILIYFIIINLTAVVLTLSDKQRAKNNKWRISEASLIIVGILGGAVCEYITMKSIHHKTKKAKFMVGLPLIIFAQIIIAILIIYKVALF